MKERIKRIADHKPKSGFKLLPTLACLTALAFVGHSAFAQKTKHESTKPLVAVPPSYPIDAAKNNVQGYVQLSFDIEQNGKVSSARVSKSVPGGVFDKAALEAIKQWQYPKHGKKRHDVAVQLDFVLSEPMNNEQ